MTEKFGVFYGERKDLFGLWMPSTLSKDIKLRDLGILHIGPLENVTNDLIQSLH